MRASVVFIGYLAALDDSQKVCQSLPGSCCRSAQVDERHTKAGQALFGVQLLAFGNFVVGHGDIIPFLLTDSIPYDGAGF